MKKHWWMLALALALLGAPSAKAEDELYTLMDEAGSVLTYYCGVCDTGDEYISQENQHYRVISVDPEKHTATAQHLGEAEMPDVSWLTMEESTAVAAVGKRKVALYCTHSDESYIEGDGTQSIEGRGGIYDIAAAFGEGLEKLGATVEISDETHLPHDAGAYRRSRQTAVSLLEGQPNAIFDIHRDGIPDPDEYAVTIGNQKMSKVRLLVGKSNQNKEANLSLAKHIKAVGDQMYPKLIKDIYMGKGTYNQDLAPRSVLLEFGTHTLSKERVMNATGPMSEVVYKAVFGGVTGSAGTSDVSTKKGADTGDVPATEDNTGASWGVWLVIALLVGLGLFAFLSSGGSGGMRKWSRSISEMTGGLIGKKPRKDD